jgi:RNA polymerase sigma-70 factor, ECF subfamily
LVKVFSRAAQFDCTRSALPWVLTIAAYECKTYRQRQRRTKLTTTELLELRSQALDPEQSAIARDLEAALFDAIQTLSANDAATLQAVLNEQRVDAPAATLRKRLSRALARLRTTWSSRHGLD